MVGEESAGWLSLLRDATGLRHHDDPQLYWRHAHEIREALDALPGAGCDGDGEAHEPPPASRTITRRRPGEGLVTVEEAMEITRRKRNTLYDWTYKHKLTTYKLLTPGRTHPHRGAPLFFVEAELRKLFKPRRPLRP